MPAPVSFGRGHRFAAYPRCWADAAEREALSQRDRLGTPHLGVGSGSEPCARVNVMGLTSPVSFSPRVVGASLWCRTVVNGALSSSGGRGVLSGHGRLTYSRAPGSPGICCARCGAAGVGSVAEN